MSTYLPTTRLYKGVTIRMLDKNRPRFGELATVQKATKYHLVLRYADGEIERVEKSEMFFASDDVSPLFLAYLDAHEEDFQRRYAEYRAKRKTEALADYTRLRQETPAEYGREASDDGQRIYYGPKVPMKAGGTYIRSFVEIYGGMDTLRSGTPRLNSVSWSSIGAVTPEEAIIFAKAIYEAANEAVAIRSKLEKEHDIVV